MAILETGSSSTGAANVDSNFNLQVNTPTTKTQAGYSSQIYEIDAGQITGSKLIRTPDVSEDNRLSIGMDTEHALYNFTTTAQNTGDFKYISSTMTATQSSGFLNLNAISSTASGNYTYMQSWRHFTLRGDGSLHIEFTGTISAAVPANQILESGLFVGTAGVVPADGAFFRLTDGGLYGVISYGGTETLTTSMGAVTPNSVGRFSIVVSQRRVEFYINGILGAVIAVPSGNAVPYLSMCLPLTMMMRNAGVVTGGFTTRVGTLHCSQMDLNVGKDWATQKGMQGDAYQGQDGDTMGPNALHTNATTAAAAALVNATAAAQFTGLGGLALVLPTLTAGTDGILFSFLNPLGSITQPPKTLVVTGVWVSSGVQTTLTGGPLNLAYALAYGSSAQTLATASETASFTTNTVKLHRRVPLGIQNYAVTAAAGTGTNDIFRTFSTPVVVNPGEYFNVVCRNLGTVTTLGALAISVGVDHYFE